MDSSPSGFTAGVRHWRDHAIQAVRRLPFLGTGLALAGVAVWMVLTVRALLATTGPDQIGRQVDAVAETALAVEQAYEFFSRFWPLLGSLLAPAFLVAVIRCRKQALVLPVALLCGWLFVWWLAGDLSQNLERAFRDPLGMQAAPTAYFVKLGLMAFLTLSVPLLMGLYFKSTLMDRYLVRSFAMPFLLCVAAIAGIMITMDLLNNANDFVDAKFGTSKILLFYLIQLPQILVTITEAALLLATLYSLGRMSRYNELISMMSAGRSVARIIAPVLIFAAWCSLAVMALNYQLAPQADRLKEEMLKDSGRRSSASRDTSGVEYNVAYRNREDRRNWLIFRLPYDLSDRNSMTEVWVMQQDEQGNPQTMIVAKRAAWNPVLRNWTFYQAAVVNFTPGATRFTDQGSPPGAAPAETGDAGTSGTGSVPAGMASMPRGRDRAQFAPVYYERLPILETWKETPGSILSDRLNPEYLGVPELLSYLRTNHSLPARNLARYESTLHWRFALPFRCFLLVLLAAPLGIVSSRRGLLGGVTMAVGLFIAVFFLSAMVLKAGEGLYLTPAAGAWLVNGAFLIIGLTTLWMRSTNRSLPSLNPFRWRRGAA